jgi:hypothetical protein
MRQINYACFLLHPDTLSLYSVFITNHAPKRQDEKVDSNVPKRYELFPQNA